MGFTKKTNLCLTLALLLILSIGCEKNDISNEFVNDKLSSNSVKLNPSSVTASSQQNPNVPNRTLDNNLGTRWSALGSGQHITYDLGSSKLVDYVKIAWFKGNQRSSSFEVWVGNSTSNLEKIKSKTTSGNTNSLKIWDLPNRTARYVRIVGKGNSQNNWNSITEVEIWGSSQSNPPSGGGGGNNTDTDLSNWKLTLPVSNSSGSKSGGQGDAYEVPATTLANWTNNGAIPNSLEPYFKYNSSGNMEFYCLYTGITTSSRTKNSRTELREMVKGTNNQKNWTLSEGGVMEGRFRVKSLTNSSKLFAMQIHGKSPVSKPLLKIIWDNGKIRAMRKIKNGGSYVDNEDVSSRINVGLNQWVTVKITCNTSELRIDVNGQLMKRWTSNLSSDWGNNTFYFKAGNYLQHHADDEGHSAVVEYEKVYINH